MQKLQKCRCGNLGLAKILVQMNKAHKWCISHDYKTIVPLKWYDNNCKTNTIWLLWSLNARNNANIAITHLYPPHKPLHSQMKRQASKAGFTPAVCESSNLLIPAVSPSIPGMLISSLAQNIDVTQNQDWWKHGESRSSPCGLVHLKPQRKLGGKVWM